VPENSLTREIFSQIDAAIETIKYRFEPVQKVDDFLDTPEGQEKLDSLCMLFIAIGESLKKVDKLTEGQLLERYPDIDWRSIKGLRDILSHHYFDMNAEAIHNVCNDELDDLHQTIKRILEDLKE
jgi:uncharacterized protein with HEPN domain